MRAPVARLWWTLLPWLLAVGVLAPLLHRRGFALVGDMVFVPEQPWKAAWLGADGRVPRAVPGDAVISLLTQVVPGDLAQKAMLTLILVLAAGGAMRLAAELGTGSPAGVAPVAARPLWAPTAAAVLAVWNPWVYQRLAIGHWSLLVGYGALWWVLVAVHRRSWPLLVTALGAAAFSSPSGGVITAVVALVAGAWVSRRWLGGTAFAVVLLNLPWILPGVLNERRSLSDSTGVEAFAAASDTPWGVLGSLVSLGGMWKTSIEVPGRDSAVISGIAIAVSCAAVVALTVRLLTSSQHTQGATGSAPRGTGVDPTGWTILVLGLLGLVAAWVPSTGTGSGALGELVTVIPGAGLARDSAKATMVLVVTVALGWAVVVAGVRESRLGGVWSAGLLTVVPLILLPGLAWGMTGRLEPVTYPADWDEVAAVLVERAEPTDRLVPVPFSVYRRFGWNADRAVLDPAPRYFGVDVVADDTLLVGELSVPGEDRGVPEVAAALAGERPVDDLAAAGIDWVLTERGTPGRVPDLEGADVAYAGPELVLHDIPRAAGTSPAGSASRELALGAVATLSAGFWLLGVVCWLLRLPRRTLPEQRSHQGELC